MHKFAPIGIATLVAAAAFASTAGAADKPGPVLLGPPVPSPIAPKPGVTTPTPQAPIKLGPPIISGKGTAPAAPLGKPSLASKRVRIPAF